MISRAAIDQRVREWGLRHEVVEKDYVLGWLLWGIGTEPDLRDAWIFKGGTCLKKCYIETYRFSEDLDFTVVDGGPIEPSDVEPVLARVLQRITDESGIDFSDRPPALRTRPKGDSVEGRVYYRGPLAAPSVASVKLDLSASELLARPPERRPIAHPYEPEETLPEPADVACYVFEEVFAEKLRAMGERARPRDLYDIVNLYRRDDLRLLRVDVHAILVEKCAYKGIAVPTMAAINESGRMPELESEWENMLGHQLPALPPLEQFLEELARLFAWLEGAAPAPALATIAVAADEDVTWSPPATVATWDTRFPLEAIRFAAVNRLCVELGYGGRTRLIEPYSLRRTRAGDLVLHALRHESREHRSYRVDRIASATATSIPFTPTYAVEFSSTGPMAAPPQTHAVSRAPARRTRTSVRSGATYVIACAVCGKHFTRKTMSTKLNPHENKYGGACSGRSGYLARVR